MAPVRSAKRVVLQDLCRKRLRQLAQAATYVIALQHVQSHYEKIPYHTSPLSGLQWLDQMLESSANPQAIYDALGMRAHVFLSFVSLLETSGGLTASRHVNTREQVAIFLYLLRHNVGVRAIASRFNRSFDTVHA